MEVAKKMKQTLIFALVICFFSFQHAYAECENQRDQNLGFQPRAITLVDLDSYDKPYNVSESVFPLMG